MMTIVMEVSAKKVHFEGIYPIEINAAIAQSNYTNAALQYLPMSNSVEYLKDEFYALDSPSRYKCCYCCHVVFATKLFLILYIIISVCGLMFGVVSAYVWIFIPIMIVSMTIYALCYDKHKYLYPFLIISVVQLIVCLVMALVVVTFAMFNYETLRVIIGHSVHIEVNSFFVVCVVGATVAGCFILAIIHLWQCFTIYNCLQYYEFAYRKENSPKCSSTTPGMQSVYENKRLSLIIPERNV
uniref:Uncharacterized protein n=1 Tax=Acrobeloides nanus TaxID=290746 RepID=A0A914CNN1_9BILA